MQTDQQTSTAINANTLDPHSWVNKYADYLYAYAITRINNEEQAKDLVQETFLAALEKVDAFEGKSSERTWLTAILKFKLIDIYRKNRVPDTQRRNSRQTDQEEQAFFDAANGHWNEHHEPRVFGMEGQDILENKEFRQLLLQCMSKLPSLWHAVFTMKHIDDASTKLICSTLKVSPSNFWVIIHRAKLNLRACLQKNWN